MTTNGKSIHRSIAVLKLPKAGPQLVTYARAIVRSMTGNAAFPAPSPTLSAMTQAIGALEAAETEALTRTKGAPAARDEKKTALVSILQQLLGYIQAQADANLESGASIIESACISLKRQGGRVPQVFAAAEGAVHGSVKLRTVWAGDRASYQWQSSTNGGQTWEARPATLQTSTKVSGLTPGSTVAFRGRAVTKAGEGDWSQPVSLLVR